MCQRISRVEFHALGIVKLSICQLPGRPQRVTEVAVSFSQGRIERYRPAVTFNSVVQLPKRLVHKAQARVRLGIVRHHFDRLPECIPRLIQPSGAAQCGAQVVVRHRKTRIRVDRRPVVADGFIQPRHVQIQIGEVVMCAGKLRVELEGVLVARFRRLKLP